MKYSVNEEEREGRNKREYGVEVNGEMVVGKIWELQQCKKKNVIKIKFKKINF